MSIIQTREAIRLVAKPRGVTGFEVSIVWRSEDTGDTVMYLKDKEHLNSVLATLTIRQKIKRRIKLKNGVHYYYFY
jgi:hypothetical protein